MYGENSIKVWFFYKILTSILYCSSAAVIEGGLDACKSLVVAFSEGITMLLLLDKIALLVILGLLKYS
jgi:hypothetical protein